DGAAFERLAHLRALPLPGGDRAAREPWRMASAALHELGRNAEIAQRFAGEPAAATLATMLQRGLNCPRTSSMGRAFDAAAGLLGLSRHMLYEAQAAITLEQAAMRHIAAHGHPEPLLQGWRIDEAGCLDLRPLFAHLADSGDGAEQGAAVFHTTLIAALADWVTQAAQRSGITMIVCGGGCFLNRLLNEGLRARLEAAGLAVRYPRAMQPGDTAIALGQAWIATRRC
ncbi:MAG: carbamoyltransferase HypF, partial [Actinomycetota bacterium]|nr:carbamoyltransferase HypF [Actinomycetota bacterium]